MQTTAGAEGDDGTDDDDVTVPPGAIDVSDAHDVTAVVADTAVRMRMLLMRPQVSML